jgi:phosphotriesterase-related protein
MSSDALRGKVQTVLEIIEPEEMGITLAHEHILIDCMFMYVEPKQAGQKGFAREKLTLRNIGWVRYNWTQNLDNVQLFDEDTAVSEVGHFLAAGGRTIVDPTSVGLGRDPEGLARISRLSGVHIVMGSGHYLGSTHPPDVKQRDEESIAEEIIKDIREGVGSTGVRAGFIGEIGCSYPIADEERKCLRAAVAAQRETGAMLMVHPGRDPGSPLQIIETVRTAGGDLARTIICHIDRTCTDRKYLADLAATGCYIEYDLFGNESSYYPPNPKVDMPSDAQRMDIVLWHFENGLERQMLLSHDIATKHRLHEYGGLGYDHLVTNLIPRLLQRGLKQEDVRTLFVQNPADAFTFR